MYTISTNNKGDRVVDPYDIKGKHERWLLSIGYPQSINYFLFKDISSESGELLTRYVLDLYVGKNLSRGSKRGQRSYIHLVNVRLRLKKLIELIETNTNKNLIDLTEDDILYVFNGMRNGTILSYNKRPYTDVASYAKKLIAFWRWILRTQKERHPNLNNIVESLDAKGDEKPKWFYFTIKDLEKMGDVAPSVYYKALIYFLFDSGIRAPKELMNVRVKDFSEVPGTNLLFLTVREDTSKTFGRKIKLMISSDIIKKFIAHFNLKDNDFLFTKAYITMSRIISRMGYKVLGIGTPVKQKRSKIIVNRGITMYDFRHNSCCHYLPIYKSENQMKYRYGWKKGEMIHYYSEFIGMRDTITEEDMLTDTTKTEIVQQLQKEQNKVTILQEQMQSQKFEMEERMKKMEQIILQKFANSF